MKGLRDGRPCKLAMEDGAVFSGVSFGAAGTAVGEVVFNTAMTGYQEVITDPSYCGQIVTMTYPLIGNYGVNDEDVESERTYLSGFVAKELSLTYSNYRASEDLSSYLQRNGVMGLAGVDTRAITRRIRKHGALRAVLSTESLDDEMLLAEARNSPSMEGRNLAGEVSGDAPSNWEATTGVGAALNVVALDCGIKFNILRELSRRGCRVTVMPGASSADAVLERKPAGVLVGNGPGDPTAVGDAIATVRNLIGKVPIFGICLGHQLLACALGADTYKLKFGHHGANHPVRNLNTGRVEITSQNHGFAVDAASLDKAGAYATHINLNDQSLEGFAHREYPLFAVQYHPEAAPGPHDSVYLFDLFTEMLNNGRMPVSLQT